MDGVIAVGQDLVLPGHHNYRLDPSIRPIWG